MDGENTKVLLVSANVGSIFEDPEHMLKIWLKEFLAAVQQMEPGLLAIHCQEVGGKNYEASMQHVNQFVKAMLGSEELAKYDRARVFLDEDYTAADKFTALGNLYFIHECIEDVFIFDFIECKFLPVEGREVLSGNIENIQIKEKAKYPQNFFPEFKWSRKGFLRTRWSINNCVFDLINIHLFHDASNIISMQKSPSIYAENRHRALSHTLQRFDTDQFEKVPYFIFGDFNFRLDLHLLLKELMEKAVAHQTKGKKDQISKVVFQSEGDNKPVLTVESKLFDLYERHSEVFANSEKKLNKYDSELVQYKDWLYEFDIDFPPSYPFSEDVNDGLSYMKTRCPSWCDRILLKHSTKDIIIADEKHQGKYGIIGKDVCMGDHKPVYLKLLLKKGKGKSDAPDLPPLNVSRNRTLSKKISINGEEIDTESEELNIHDYAVFAKQDCLIPEFRLSIKTKSGSVTRQYAEDSEEQGSDGGSPTLKRQRSFQNVARQVVSMESVLLKWPRRPKSRHHSSSSEDLAEDDVNRNNNDAMSVDTDVFELSDSEEPSKSESKATQSADTTPVHEANSELIRRKNVGDVEGCGRAGKAGVLLHGEDGKQHGHEKSTEKSQKTEPSPRRRCPCVVL